MTSSAQKPARNDTARGYRLIPNASLRDRNTFQVEARANLLAEIHDAAAIPMLLEQPEVQHQPLLVLGGGSNVLFVSDFNGVVITPVMRGIEILTEDATATRIRIAAGEHWNDCVRWTLAHDYAGLENLSLIPGSAGAAPIQNIGAYGVEIAEFIETIETYDLHQKQFVTLDNDDCQFSYRDSIFKHQLDRWLITHMTLRLPKSRELRTDYKGIQDELGNAGIKTLTANDIAHVVITLRTRKLPDPSVIGNAGSFFKNPIVSLPQADALRRDYPQLPSHATADGQRKLSAAWLIDQCGFKGIREGDAGIADSHALVLVNHGHATGAQLWALAQHIQTTVSSHFGIALQPEPRIIG